MMMVMMMMMMTTMTTMTKFCELEVVFGFFGFCAALQAVGLCLVRYVPRPYQDRTVVKKHHVRLRYVEYI